MSQPASIPKLLLHHAVETPDKVAFLGPGWAVVRIPSSLVWEEHMDRLSFLVKLLILQFLADV